MSDKALTNNTRLLPISVTVTLILGAITASYAYGQLWNRVEVVEAEVQQIDILKEDVSEIKQDLSAIKRDSQHTRDTLSRIERKLDTQ